MIARTGGAADFARARYHLAQSDLRVGGTPAATRGDNVYNLTAEGQKLQRYVRYGAPAALA